MEAIKHTDGTWDIIGLEPWEETFERMCIDVITGRPFKFARHGDGEIFCMTGKRGHNCDHHEYFIDLGNRLVKSVVRANYMIGIQPLSIHGGMYESVKKMFENKDLRNADVLHNASIKGRFWQFYDRAFEMETILVGPEHLKMLNARAFIEIPTLNCWNDYFKTCVSIASAIKRMKNPVVLLCASMMSEVIIDQFRDHDNVTIVDCGSAFDPYCGKLSRSYHHKLNLNGH